MQALSELLPQQMALPPASKSSSQTLPPVGAIPPEIGAQPRPVLPEKVSEIELSAEEIRAVTEPAVAAALWQARKAKWEKIKAFQYWWDLSNPQQARRLQLNDLKRTYVRTASAAVHPRPYELDNGLAEILHTLALYFSEHEDFATKGDGYSLQKGLMVIGTVGVGKTRMMELWGQINRRMRFGVLACDLVADAYGKDGMEGLEKWYERRPSGICFDDLGTETLVLKNFGNEISPMERVLRRRHELQRTGVLEPIATHITTNLTWDGLKPYGARLLDRLPEMFNLIHFPTCAASRRK